MMQHPLADGRERGAEIDRGRGLADAALLVGDGKDAGAGGGSGCVQARCDLSRSRRIDPVGVARQARMLAARRSSKVWRPRQFALGVAALQEQADGARPRR